MLYRPISSCRICGNRALARVLDLGELALTGVFPKSGEAAPTGPLTLVRCSGDHVCGLVQLAGDYAQAELYGDSYGYRSGLNQTMVRHLEDTVRALCALRPVARGDVVLDIGSNDGTTLGAYPRGPTLVGIDPTLKKFSARYRDDIVQHAALFSAEAYRSVMGDRRARIVTSISMFYDLPDPQRFVDDVAAVLADDGIWHLEQSYLPTMLATHSYDTACHEHLEYYGLKQLVWMFDRAGLCVRDVSTNDVNGGSLAVTAVKARAGEAHCTTALQMIAGEEHSTSPAVWQSLAAFTRRHQQELPAALAALVADGKKVIGLGASTKGNVTLQHCGIGPALVSAIGEVNPDKYGRFTPGTRIPIVPEAEALAAEPDVLFVLPWHFRPGFLAQHQQFLARGGRFLFPLPHIELVSA